MSLDRWPQGVAAIAVALALGGCAMQPLQSGSGSPEGAPGAQSQNRRWPDPVQDANAYRADSWGLVSMPVMESYLNGLYTQIKTLDGHPDWPGKVYVLTDPSLKLQSSAAGNVYISLGWIRSIESEDEIFALLSHEYAHVAYGHHTLYDVAGFASTVSRIAETALSMSQSSRPANSFDRSYWLAAGREITGRTLLPAWKRSVEEQADLYGARLSLRAGYSYARGFKTFLERIASYDQSFQSTAKGTRTATGPKPGGAAPQGQAGSASAPRWSDDHGDAIEREDALSTAISPELAGRPRSEARVEPWRKAARHPETAEILDHYAKAEMVPDLLESNRPQEAYKLARIAASGRTANDAMPVFQLAQASGAMRASPAQQQLILLRHLDATERSWKMVLQVSRNATRSNRTAAKNLLDAQFDLFGRPPMLYPEVIEFYRLNGFANEAKSLSATCTIRYADYRDACSASAKSDAEKQAEKAAAEREGKKLADQLTSKIKFK
ncbi:M48 family metalloprotease [Variovorax saccharolyticus]|uniref:M48 family metalloprotease n=1 Tax=Variovorax saccharolyticus TaxID=3053516 RepID=UPI002576BE97|nr:M48 family metalloprotease [Variovorax sp. J31P216]MDM0029180.1 M48 family metalloprotease [Variovorax sp. J31P216]